MINIKERVGGAIIRKNMERERRELPSVILDDVRSVMALFWIWMVQCMK
jgi:hypothetical protein